MSRPARIAFRLPAVLITLGLLSALAGAPGPAKGPYVSALSNLAVGSAVASPGCENKACATDPNTLKFICVKNTGTTCAVYNSKGPIASKCIENAC